MQVDNASNKIAEEIKTVSPQLDTEIDLQDKRWNQGLAAETPRLDEDESQNNTEIF